MALTKKQTALVTIIISAMTTTALDWTFAKVQEYTVNIPIFTTMGVFTQEVRVEEKRGPISGHTWSRELK